MYEFTPVSALIGGGLIGISAALMLLLLGRQTGASGIFGSLFTLEGWQSPWRPAFIAGILIPPMLLWFIEPERLTGIQITASPSLLILGGFLTGLGTQMGSGCTSGHGICGIGRLSARSLMSVFIFLSVAMAVATIGASL